MAAPCNNVCMWFVTQDSDIQMKFRDEYVMLVWAL
jgi:hypothetical protein